MERSNYDHTLNMLWTDIKKYKKDFVNGRNILISIEVRWNS